MSKPTRLWWRICPRLYHTVAPGIARAAYAARWPSPSESWCRTWRRCRKHRDCPWRGLSAVPWQQTLWWLVYLLSQHWAVFKALRLAATHSLSHRELVCVCGYLVCVQFRGHHCNEVLKHLVIWDASTQETIIEGFMKKKKCTHSFNGKSFSNVSCMFYPLKSCDLLLYVIFSVPSRGLMTPGNSSPKDKWSIRWEKLYAVMQRWENPQIQSRLWTIILTSSRTL